MTGRNPGMSDRSEESLTAYAADFIARARAAAVPADVTHLGKRSILDGIGLALAGSVAESGHIVRRYLRSLGCTTAKGSTVIGSPLELPARFAAFANGVAIHADDYDDTQLAVAKDRVYGLLTHPTAPALPPVLALGERDGRSGRDVLTAYQGGVEAGRGFFKAAGGGFDARAIEGKLGNPWTFAFPGVSIKPHPSGSLTHPGMGLALDLILEHDIKPGQVERVSVGVNRQSVNALIHNRPQSELQAKFSMPFCIAILLLRRKAGLAEFTDAVVNRPDVKAMIERIDYNVHPEAEAAGYEKMTTLIEIKLADGRTVSGHADFGKGSPTNPMSDDELAVKFRECAAWGGLPRTDAEKIIELVFRLDKLKNINELTRLLGTGAKSKRKARRS